MKNNYTLKDFSDEVIRRKRIPLTTFEIWQFGKEMKLDVQGGFTGKTPWTTINQKLMIDIQENSQSKFTIIENTRPKKYFLKDIPHSSDDIAVINKKIDLSFDEKDLHPVLSYFVYTYLGRVYTKTIKHNISNRQNSFQKWLHPDLVGVSYPVGIWEVETLALSKEMKMMPLKLYSFELKKQLNEGNLREAFFQAVSNSSWAHEGYLVSSGLIEQDEDFEKELKRLSNSFGIGIINLELENFDDSKVMFPAKTNENLDWETINKLANVNPDFKNFLIRIKNDAHNNEIIKEKYDKIFETDELKVKFNKTIY